MGPSTLTGGLIFLDYMLLHDTMQSEITAPINNCPFYFITLKKCCIHMKTPMSGVFPHRGRHLYQGFSITVVECNDRPSLF